MAKRGVTSFSATKVAKAGLAASAALQRILNLEKEVSRLRHNVSVLSKWNHGLGKEVERLKGGDESEEEMEVEVASPVRGKEPEPQVVAEPSGSGKIVVEEDEDVWVASVAKPAVAESRVALVVDDSEVAMVRLPKGKKRRVEREESVKVGVMVATKIPSGPRGGPKSFVAGAPKGPRSDRVMGTSGGRGFGREWLPQFFLCFSAHPGALPEIVKNGLRGLVMETGNLGLATGNRPWD